MDRIGQLLEVIVAFQDFLRSRVLEALSTMDSESRTRAARESVADTLFGIDEVVEAPALEWLDEHWPKSEPAILVMEGVDERHRIIPKQAGSQAPIWTLIVDPIDGTRPLMHLKRSAWILSGLAPMQSSVSGLEALEVGAMTEIPLPQARWSEQILAIKNQRLSGWRYHIDEEVKESCEIRPSSRKTLDFGFAGLFRGIPQGRVLSSKIEERFYHLVFGERGRERPLLFEDQYISTGGQLYGLITGRDLMVADLRPLIFEVLNLPGALCCHPYDLAALPVARKAGAIIRGWDSLELNVPLDTTSPVAWVGYANAALYEKLHPPLVQAVDEVFSQEIQSGQ